MESLLTSPLHERHLALGAKLGEFGGWSMPLEYAGGGVLAEHAAVRAAVGVFDVSHLGKASVTGPGAKDFLNATLTNDLGRIAPGKAQYTLCCDDPSGGVVDDLIVYLRGDDDCFLVPNAANTAEVVRRLQAAAPPDVRIENLHRDFAVIAVQGPRSKEVLDDAGLRPELEYMAFADTDWGGVHTTLCRSGYTGEHGYELVVPADQATTAWDRIFQAGERFGARACGLGARDTLRTEMGYPLHGQDLSLDITPNQARVGWAVGWKKPSFWGRDLLLAEREQGPRRVLRGLVALDRGIPRAHMPVLDADGATVGEVTSGTFSPTRRVGIALALLSPTISEDDEVVVDVRGRPCPTRVVKPPFVDRSPQA
ncbi:MAG TPA: glycine cleavage system aminomethyltransferase GcvT [Acidothermaceae bacterium]|nr:glycine cleavage system aminomethyltransferase GcvT [Acidothermaceae bacterium]